MNRTPTKEEGRRLREVTFRFNNRQPSQQKHKKDKHTWFWTGACNMSLNGSYVIGIALN